MRKKLIVFSAVLLTGACQKTNQPVQTTESVCDQVSFRRTRAEVLPNPVNADTPPGMEPVSLDENPGPLAPGAKVAIFVDSQKPAVGGTVFISGPYPSLTVLVTSDQARKIRDAKNIEIGVFEWPLAKITLSEHTTSGTCGIYYN
jgi:hypothetical protein